MRDVDDVGREVLGRADGGDVAGPGDQTLAREEPGGELLVLPGRAHGDGDRPAVNADLERLFHGELVLLARAVASRGDPLDPALPHVAVEGPLHQEGL